MSLQKTIKETPMGTIVSLLSSVNLGVALLIMLALVSIIGTVIQQNENMERYLLEYSQSTVRLFDALGLFDMYHTWWFVLLLVLLSVNLVVCSLTRFPRTWQTIKAPLPPLDNECLQGLPCKKEFTTKQDAETFEAKVLSVLKTRGFRVREARKDGMVHLMAQKGAYSRMGFYLTHLSIVLIIIGALIGSFFGFKGYLNLPEGVAQKSVYLRTEPLWNKLMTNLGMAKSRVQWSFEAGMPTWPLGFMVQCDDFDADYYVNAAGMPTGMPSEYRSTLSILDLERRKILDKRITVNDPLTYRGITFYQSSYGAIPDATGYAVLNIRANNAPGSGETVVIRLGSSVRVLSIDRTIKLLGFSPFGMRDPVTGNVALYHTENNDYINPAVQLEISKGSKRLYTAEILKTDKSPPVLPEPYTISLIRYGGTRLTGLQVTKDPGVWVVYSGFILLCVGPLIAFFGSHKKLWVRIARRNNGGTVVVAGSVNKNRMGFEREFKAILSALIK